MPDLGSQDSSKTVINHPFRSRIALEGETGDFAVDASNHSLASEVGGYSCREEFESLVVSDGFQFGDVEDGSLLIGPLLVQVVGLVLGEKNSSHAPFF